MKLTMKLLVLLFCAQLLASSANAESPREQLKQMVDQLHQNPDDDALREKIIMLARTVKSTIPEVAVRYLVIVD
ncbi:MAG: hypothetical protein HY799_06775 [Nitrosomonadales bacterium]|nr:hypothetical protein [Nitrosomonadales bacterium]